MLAQLAAVHDSIAAAGNAVIGIAPASGDQARHLMEESIPFNLYIDRQSLVGDRIGIGRQSLAHFVFSLPAWWRYLKAFFSRHWQQRITGHYSNLPGVCVVEPSGEVTYAHRGTGLGDYPPIDEVLAVLNA